MNVLVYSIIGVAVFILSSFLLTNRRRRLQARDVASGFVVIGR